MARTVPAATQTKLENNLGEEIVVVLEVFWTDRTATKERKWYADRSIPGAPEVQAKILELGSVNSAVQVLQGGQSQSVNVVLDDQDGELKAIFDVNDIHKIPVRMWFYVSGTNFATDKFSIFLGQINNPITWSEGERTFSFSVINRIEDVEVGFSAEEGDFPLLPKELIGRPWPLCFGTTKNIPALRAVPAISGVLASGVGIKDFTLAKRIQLANEITCPSTPIGFKCAGAQGLASTLQCIVEFETDQNCLQQKCLELERLRLELEEQSKYEYTQISIFGGEQFPQGRTITLDINGGLFTGFFDGTPTSPSTTFVIKSRRHPLFDPATGSVKSDPVKAELESKCPGDPSDAQDSNFTDIYSGPVWTGLRNSRISWENYRREPAANFFWADGGSTVRMTEIKEIVYIANIVPSTILAVRAKRRLNNNEVLLAVPEEFYEVRQTDYGGYQVMEIVFQQPLSSLSEETGGGWSDDIFVSQTSTVGPNTVDIIRWLIETYTSFGIDDASFNDVRTKIDVYRMDFPLLHRPNLIRLLQDIARKARCALFQRDNTFFIRYLAETPTPVATIGEDDVLQESTNVGSLLIDLTNTLDIVTKMTATWQEDYALSEPNRLILRHNVKKYGTHPEEEDYFQFAFLDLVRKSATFWLIRSANTWKRLRLLVSLEYALLEPFDAVTLNLPDVANGSFLGVVEQATLDTDGKQIQLEVWTPVRAGEMTPYNFAFPAGISENALFPTLEATALGEGGSGAEPNFSTIAPPGHPLSIDHPGVYSGFSLGCNGDAVVSVKPGECRQDHGDKFPSDVNDKKPEPNVKKDITGPISSGTSPISNGAGFGANSNIRLALNQLDKIEGDAGRAREVAESGGTGDSPRSGDNNDPITVTLDEDFLNSLPTPAEIEETNQCHYKVAVTGFNTKSSFQGVPTQEVCTPDGGTFTETYVVDSLAAANALCQSLLGRPSCGGKPPCNSCISSCSIAASPECDGTNDGGGNIIGYQPGPGGASKSFLLK